MKKRINITNEHINYMIDNNYPIENKNAIANKQQTPKSVKDNIYIHTSKESVKNSKLQQQMALLTESKRQRNTINYADQSLANSRSVNDIIRVIQGMCRFRRQIKNMDSTDKSHISLQENRKEED